MYLEFILNANEVFIAIFESFSFISYMALKTETFNWVFSLDPDSFISENILSTGQVYDRNDIK